MKKLVLILISVLLIAATFAQGVPQTVNFSATVRNSDNTLLQNADVTVKISFKNSGNSVVYREEHMVKTNTNGFVSFLLNREMSAHEGVFENIPWQSSTYTMKVEYKLTGSGEYIDLGSHELTSSFYALTSNYALIADTAQNLAGFPLDVAGARDGDVLVYNGETGKWEASSMSSLLEAMTYTITFNANGGNGTMAPQTFFRGVPQAISANTFRKGNHPFTGWNTEADGSGTSYTSVQSITLSENMTLYAQWDIHEYVDLGLPSGRKWATCNIGATRPEQYGYYFAWGETSTKTTYTEGNYTYSGNPDILPLSADAANANWGSGWRMPTDEEILELHQYIQIPIEQTTMNGVIGYSITGPNGNSIFLPGAGYYSGTRHVNPNATYFWTSLLNTEDSSTAWRYQVVNADPIEEENRYFGLTIRAVWGE